MGTKRIEILKGLYHWLMLDRLEKRILKLLLEQGKSYKIRLYYFIPKIETAVPLIMNIKKVQMILMGARE